MSDVVYVSKSRIERRQGPLRVAHLPGESRPVICSVHGAIAEHFKMDPAKLKESHSSTIEHQNAAVKFAIVTKRVVSYYEVDGYKRRGGREAEGGGLLIHSDLSARTDFRLFC